VRVRSGRVGRVFKLPWREAGRPNNLDDKVDSNHQVVNKELSFSLHARVYNTIPLSHLRPGGRVRGVGSCSVSRTTCGVGSTACGMNNMRCG